MKGKQIICLLFFIIAACKDNKLPTAFEKTFPEEFKGRTFEFNWVMNNVCYKERGKCILQGDVLYFLQKDYVFVTSKDIHDCGNDCWLYTGYSNIKTILPYKTVVLALSMDGLLYIVDPEKHYQLIGKNVWDVKVVNDHIIVVGDDLTLFNGTGINNYTFKIYYGHNKLYYCAKDLSDISCDTDLLLLYEHDEDSGSNLFISNGKAIFNNWTHGSCD